MGASRRVDDGLSGVAGGTGYRRQLGDVEEAVSRPTLSACSSRALYHPGLCEVATPVAWPVPTPGTEIELQRRDGARRRIHSSAAHLPLATLLRTFLETP